MAKIRKNYRIDPAVLDMLQELRDQHNEYLQQHDVKPLTETESLELCVKWAYRHFILKKKKEQEEEYI